MIAPQLAALSLPDVTPERYPAHPLFAGIGGGLFFDIGEARRVGICRSQATIAHAMRRCPYAPGLWNKTARLMHEIACHECDLVHEIPSMSGKAAARCVRCGAVLFRNKPDSINRTLAWTLAGLVLYAVAVTFPFLSIKSGAIVQKTALLTGVHELYQQKEWILAILVFMTCVLIPLLQMSGLLYVFIPLKLGRRARFAIPVFRLFQHVRPWSM